MRPGTRDLAAILALLAVAVVVPTAVALAAGAIDIPRNDDWSYRGIALHLYQTGRLELDGNVASTLVGQILFAQPFLWLTGGATWALTVVGLLAAVVAIVAGYLLVRRLVPAGRATLAVLLLALFPGYLAYVPTYMTDVPAMAAEFVCLGLGIAAVSGGRIRGRWLVASMVVGIFAFTIREFALAAPASVLVAAVLIQPRRWLPWLTGFAVVVSCVAIYSLRTQLPGQIGLAPHPVSDYFSDRVARAVSSLAFVLLPAAVVAAASWWRTWRPTDVAVGAILGLILVRERIGDLVASQTMPPVLLDNLASQWGSPLQYMTFGSRPLLFSDVVWSTVNGIALVATIVVFAVGAGIVGFHARRAVRSPRAVAGRLASPAGIVLMFCVAMSVGLIAFGLTGTMYDRYLWPLVPTLAGLLLMRPLEQELVAPAPETATASGAPRPVGPLPVAATVAVIAGARRDRAAFDAQFRGLRSGALDCSRATRRPRGPRRVDRCRLRVGRLSTRRRGPTSRTRFRRRPGGKGCGRHSDCAASSPRPRNPWLESDSRRSIFMRTG